MTNPVSRRSVLRGLGTTVALPFLDAMAGGSLARAATAGVTKAAANAAAAATASPTRVAWFFIPNGVNMQNWRPSAEGALGALPPTLAPLKASKEYLTVLSGLTLDNARAKGDGPGDHARSAAAFLTGAHPRKTAGSNIKLGVSADQVIANAIGTNTKLPSLEIGLDRGDRAGNCDSGYACAYVSNISWRSESAPMPKELNPASLFDRLFGAGGGDKHSAEAREKRLKQRKSILDFVADDSRRLAQQLGKDDQRKLDEYASSVREIEKRVDKARELDKQTVRPDMPRPDGVPGDMAEHMKLMCDLLWLAWRTDQTRVATCMIARDGSNRSYPWLGVKEGHHSVSHHGRNPDKLDAIKKIDLFHLQMFAYFVDKLRTTKEGDGNMLDHSLIMLGSGISDGDRHNHDDLPIITLGKGNGLITPNRHVTYPRNTPLCNLYLHVIQGMGAKEQRFGDSDGKLPKLTA
jgi:hypothetical protein